MSPVNFFDFGDRALFQLPGLLRVAARDAGVRLTQLDVVLNHLEEVRLGVVVTLVHVLDEALTSEGE